MDGYTTMMRKYKQPIPTRLADGQWSCQAAWIAHATRDIGGMNALCVDAADRICACGKDFQRAEDEGTYPVRYYFGAGGASITEQRKEAARARRVQRERMRYR